MAGHDTVQSVIYDEGRELQRHTISIELICFWFGGVEQTAESPVSCDETDVAELHPEFISRFWDPESIAVTIR